MPLPFGWKLISLLDMIKVRGGGLVHVGNMLGLLQSCGSFSKIGPSVPQSFSISIPAVPGNHTINFNASDDAKQENKSAQEWFPEIVTWFEDLGKRCEELSLKVSAKQVARIIDELRLGAVSLEKFGSAAAELNARLEDELSEVLMLQIDKNADLYEARFPFGEEVAQKLPSAAEDAQEAATCLSLERWTACVFHLMRVVEIGVQKFGDKISVQLTGEKNWQNILDEINKAIKGMDPKADTTKSYASLAAHLYNVKLAWRNEVMHPKATYTPQEADEIYKHVAIFMRHLVQVVM